VHFGTKLALAIGTARRLEHDEADTVFGYCCAHGDSESESTPDRHETTTTTTTTTSDSGGGGRRGNSPPSTSIGGVPLSGTRSKETKPKAAAAAVVDVFVREKVRVESADPSLLSLSAKLTALGHTLAQARRNLAAVMGEEWEEGED
jgi:hypothetical protein